MCRQETHLELQLLGRGTVPKGDIISSPKHLSALGSLYHSVVSLVGSWEWLLAKYPTDLVCDGTECFKIIPRNLPVSDNTATIRAYECCNALYTLSTSYATSIAK